MEIVYSCIIFSILIEVLGESLTCIFVESDKIVKIFHSF